ncbi:glycosyl hydrolase family 16 laminarinase (macronuclear) [Tetrahymena thermophila SB210]|uniref:Glycosyl hydrolase family 16 laminarinase n=1 Tax=Tetrahymena thermophila (strain SB210) TaxID=312017 RepID=Q23RQ1_TETTS|nr:glycosyl hydrolase family 16 laminarinase [Tetrahymena thermophila SB210]EAR99186.2 glycosyl hydrolase family 16 laminarinase [Tetrahymena thermophila SB210]|eukprot:XP_001019431.2 glycosyl hydrolase family 16 laminarinase [Tetrahymena thermophila SB210]
MERQIDFIKNINQLISLLKENQLLMRDKQQQFLTQVVVVLIIIAAVCIIYEKADNNYSLKLNRVLQQTKSSNYQVGIPIVQSLKNQEWVEVFRDDFNGTKLNTTIWTARNNMTHGSWEQQLYQSDDVYVENGNLVLRTRFNPQKYIPSGRLYNYTSGWVDSQGKFSYKYGYAEARILFSKIVKNDPIWPAFWSIGENTYWPNGGEIDTMEMSTQWGTNGNPKIWGTYHWGKTDQCNGCGSQFTGNLDFSEYHTYTTVWNETQIYWYVDGIHYKTNVNGTTYPNTKSPLILPNYSQYFIINDALWGTPEPNPSDYPKYMYIDYVRVLQTKETFEKQQKK